ncbi:MAG: SGNH/GDSL hydrolase family protein [Clostridia bacterium]|nr:SGNH/GDSL hydrolase family protein [Clostridia bacterium]
MKRLSKILAPFLAVIMLASSLLIPAYAIDTQEDPYAKFKEGTGYVAIGDSFTRGYGAGDNWQNEIYLNDTYGNYNCRNVGGSYPNLVAEALGLNAPSDIRDTNGQLWPIAHDALTTAYVLDLLGVDDGYRDEEFVYRYSYMMDRYKTDLSYFGDPSSYAVDGQSNYGQTGEVASVRELLKNASLITLGVGQADIIYKTQIFGLNTLDLNDTANLPAGIANILKLFNQYFNYWKKAYPLLLDFIKENNPDAEVMLIGTTNPLAKATLTDDIALPIGSIINFMFDSINAYTKECALKYGYTYIDITDVETPASATQMSIGHILSITDDTEYALIAHPTAKGYSQIADKIIKAINENIENEAICNGFKNVTGVKDFFEKLFNLVKTVFTRLTADIIGKIK